MEKKRNAALVVMVMALVFAAVAGGCDIYNPVIDPWWVGPDGGGGGMAIFSSPITSYIVTFDMNGGKYVDLRPSPLIPRIGPIPDQLIRPGVEANEPGLVIMDNDNDDIADPGYFFDGWYNTKTGTRWDFSNPVTANDVDANGKLNLQARWTTSGVTVTFDNNLPSGKNDADTTYGSPPLPESVTAGTTLSEPKDFGLTDGTSQFVGWYKDDNGDGDNNPNTGTITKWNFKTDKAGSSDFTLHAMWVPGNTATVTLPGESTPKQVYAIEFDDNVPTNPNTIPIQYKIEGDTITKPDAIDYPNYVFNGWYTRLDLFPTSRWNFDTPLSGTTPTTGTDGVGRKELTLYAKWLPEQYTDAWFEHPDCSTITKRSGATDDYYTFQYETGSHDLTESTDDTWVDNLAIIQYTLYNNPNLKARIIGYKDSGTDSDTFVSQREIDMWNMLTMGDGGPYARPEQLVINSQLAAGYPGDPAVDDSMIFGPNPSKGAAAPDEVRVYIFQELNY